MVRSLTIIPAMMCAAVIVAAQTPTQTPPTTYPPAAGQPATTQRPSEPSGQMTSANKVTYSGCVRPSTTAETWILENADLAPKAGMAGATASSAPAPADHTPAGTSGTMKTTLNLTTKPGTDLKAHENHKVELTGTLGPATSAAQAGREAGQSSSSAASTHRAFTVDSIKMVSATCP